MLNLGGKKKPKKKRRHGKDALMESAFQSEIKDEITSIKKRFNKHSTSAEVAEYWAERKKYVD